MTLRRLLFCVLLTLPMLCMAQISVQYPDGTKPSYRQGDTVRMTATMKLGPQSCLDGMKKTAIYFSECEDLLKKPWTNAGGNAFRKEMLIRIIGKKKDKATVTISRKTDKESLFRQETFKITR